MSPLMGEGTGAGVGGGAAPTRFRWAHLYAQHCFLNSTAVHFSSLDVCLVSPGVSSGSVLIRREQIIFYLMRRSRGGLEFTCLGKLFL